MFYLHCFCPSVREANDGILWEDEVWVLVEVGLDFVGDILADQTWIGGANCHGWLLIDVLSERCDGEYIWLQLTVKVHLID